MIGVTSSILQQIVGCILGSKSRLVHVQEFCSNTFEIDFVTKIFAMAYALGFPKDVTELLYSMRDPNSWNGDKNRSTPLGKLFSWKGFEQDVPVSFPRCSIERDPLAPRFVGRGQEEGVDAKVYTRSWASPYDNVCLYQQDLAFPWCFDEVAVLRVTECYSDLAKPFDFFTCEPCLPNNENP